MNNKITGKLGEELAQNYLKNKGYKILESNYRFSKISEIDIIALKDKIIHFIEVKTRKNVNYGLPQEAITAKKLASIHTCAKYYLSQTKVQYNKIQIDAVAILIDKDNNCNITFIENIEI